MRKINNSDYMANEKGEIFNPRGRKLKPFPDSKGRYLQISIRRHDSKKTKKELVHRVIAETFLDKPEGKNIVHHKDANTQNNHADNLEWCTQQENLYYSGHSPVRNYRECFLYKDAELIGEFKSISEASRFGFENFGISASSLCKYLEVGEYHIKKV